MIADDFELDPGDRLAKMCGKIFSTVNGMFVFICGVCEKKYTNYENFLMHFSKNHHHQLDFDDSDADMEHDYEGDEENCYNIDETTNMPRSSVKEEEQRDARIIKPELLLSDCDDTMSSFKQETESDFDLVSWLQSDDDHCSESSNMAWKTNGNDAETLIDASPSSGNNMSESGIFVPRKPKKRIVISPLDLSGKEIRCLRCPEIFTEIEKLKTHMNDQHASFLEEQRQSEEENLTATRTANVVVALYPNGGYTKEESVSEKKENSERGKFVKCLKCDALTEVEFFREHMKEHTNYLCSRCSTGFLSKKKYEVHMESLHTEQSCPDTKHPHQCPLCDFAFRLGSKLKEHMNLHYDAVSYECNLCKKKFKAESNLKLHMRVHYPEKPYECGICGISMTCRSNIKEHVMRHLRITRNLLCDKCDCKFYKEDELKRHIQSKHSEERPHLCPKCGLAFTFLAQLTLHRNKHHEVRERNVKCEICSRSFFTKNHLRNHMATHVEERNYPCNTCDASFKSRKTLTNHIKLHENKREYKCKLCIREFNQYPALVAHVKNKHSGLR